MKKYLFLLTLLSAILSCKAQEIINYRNLQYEGYSYHGTLNKSFINKRILFLNGKDSIIFNIKIPFEITTKIIYDPGIFYNCKLKKDSIYSFELRKTTNAAIPKEYNSYYVTNGCFSFADKSKFREVKKDTKYQYQGNYGMFIDIDNELFIVEKMTPASDCVFQH